MTKTIEQHLLESIDDTLVVWAALEVGELGPVELSEMKNFLTEKARQAMERAL